MPYVELRGDEGQAWRLRYPMKALRWFEEQTGESFVAMATAFSEGRFSLEQASWLMAAALYHERPEVTLSDADVVFESVGFQPGLTAIAATIERSALAKGIEEPGEAAAEGPATKNAGTGTRSNKRPRKSA